jgi:DNA transposition AAA+ family ATPase
MITFTESQKTRIAAMVRENYEDSSFYDPDPKARSQPKYAISIDMGTADISNVFNGKYDLLGPKKWLKLARIVGFNAQETEEWRIAETKVKTYLDGQLKACKEMALFRIFVDDAGIGKTTTCKAFKRANKNTYYIDCSTAPNKGGFIRALGRAVGSGSDGKLNDALEDAIYALQQSEKPLIILDEAGDLDQAALLVVKRMYNALEGCCGIYMVGADGLRSKIKRGIANQKNGFVEIFSRFGKRYNWILGKENKDQKQPLMDGVKADLITMAMQIAIENGITDEDDLKKITASLRSENVLGDMRRVKTEVIKLKQAA